MFLFPRKLSRLYLQQENSTNVIFFLSLAHTCGYCLLERKKNYLPVSLIQQWNEKGAKTSLSQPAPPPGVWWKNKSTKRPSQSSKKLESGFRSGSVKCPSQFVALSLIHCVKGETKKKKGKNLDLLETSGHTFLASNSKSLSLAKLLSHGPLNHSF